MNEEEQLLKLIKTATSPFHAVREAARQLSEAGFIRLDPGEQWELERGKAYYLVHHGSTLAAFRIGKDCGRPRGFRIAAAHTDFPCLRIKTNPDMQEEGYGRVNVEIYGGATLNTWMDRPLSVAGRAALRSGELFRPRMELIDVRRPVLTIPNLAIHLNKELNKGQELNKQTDMLPLACMAGEEERTCFTGLLAEELGVLPQDILDFELTVYCAEEGCLLGIKNDFLSAPRLDNMTSVQAVLTGIIEGERQEGVQVAALFDHEEIGSRTKQGAGSVFLPGVLERIGGCLSMDRVGYLESLENSMLLSVDVGHAYHPNQGKKYDPVNKAVLNSGVTIKEAAGQSYATDSEGVAIVQQICEREKIPFKKFVNRSDGTSGSTLGSIASSLLPVMTVDVGVPLLAMHSARELMGAEDQKSLTDLVRAYFSLS